MNINQTKSNDSYKNKWSKSESKKDAIQNDRAFEFTYKREINWEIQEISSIWTYYSKFRPNNPKELANFFSEIVYKALDKSNVTGTWKLLDFTVDKENITLH